ncbi:hypothetical protein LA080_008222 [Diaporthe eres]|uniref:Uncharacterized protein n=1 Tax=Diaporthe vaccinii TaxID=105482 RepID=A0ABR4E1M8_9PEZI|nr:hypothetical protein LA080_008222 [Diaporthe eres]
MKYSTASILLIATALTVQAIPTAIPSTGGRARGLPYNAVRNIHSQRRRQETTAAGDTAIPDVTSVLDIPTSDPVLPPTSVGIVTSEPTAITSDADIPTSEPLPPTTIDVITSEPAAITSIPDAPTSEPLPPTTTDVVTSEPVTVLQTFRVKARQGTVTVIPTQAATPIETLPEVDSPTANPETPIETFPVVDSPTADLATPIETFIARSPYTNTATPPTTTA